VRGSLLVGNFIILATVVGVVLINPHSGQAIQSHAASASSAASFANPLDQLASANIALTVARMSGLTEATAITNQADSQAAELTMSSASDSVVAKAQVVTTAYKTNKDIAAYTTVAGDTVSGLAATYGTTSDSIRWSNNITGESLAVGTKLIIPPIPGIVHTITAGETAASLATKFTADKDKLIAFNDAEISGLQVGEQIVIPGASKAAAIATQAASSYSFGWGGTASYGSNGYDFGYCTWWVAKLRADSGNPLPSNLGNASTWVIRARAYGLPTGTTPRVGAAVVTKTIGAGHVGYVTAVNDDGSIAISEMNRQGWNQTDTRILINDGFGYIY
jgi:surface antigen